MQISASLYEELLQRESENQWDVIVAPILMFSEGRPLTYGSLCPPKAIFFRGKASHFEPCGHGERIIAGTRVASVRNTLIHDDRKPYSQYLLTQLRYANSLRARSTEGKLTWRDRIRLRWPLLAIVVPMYSFILKLGFLSGSVGIIYAIDRAVAELLQYRQALASSLHDDDRQTVMDQQNNYLKS